MEENARQEVIRNITSLVVQCGLAESRVEEDVLRCRELMKSVDVDFQNDKQGMDTTVGDERAYLS